MTIDHEKVCRQYGWGYVTNSDALETICGDRDGICHLATINGDAHHNDSVYDTWEACFDEAIPLPAHAVIVDVRISHTRRYFDNEAKADEYGEQVKAQGYKHNGGMFDGMPGGRVPDYDFDHAEHGRLYCVIG